MATITETGTIDLKAQKKAHDEAAKTATNYITADSTGITIRMSSSATTYQKLTATDTTWYASGKKRSSVSNDGLKVFVGDAGSEVQVASFGSTARIGKATEGHVDVTSSGMDVYTDNTTSVASFGASTRIGATDQGHMLVGSTGLILYDDTNTEFMRIEGSSDGTNSYGDITIKGAPNITSRLYANTAGGLDLMSSSAYDGNYGAGIDLSANRYYGTGGSNCDTINLQMFANNLGRALRINEYTPTATETLAEFGNFTNWFIKRADFSSSAYFNGRIYVDNYLSSTDTEVKFAKSPAVYANVNIHGSMIDRDGSYSTTEDVYDDTRTFRIVDADLQSLMTIRTAQRTTGRIDTQIITWNTNENDEVVYNIFTIGIHKNGTRAYAVSDPSAFRDALGASSGVFPRSVGGTGMSARTTGTVTRTGLSTSAGTINAYSNGIVNTVSATACKLKTALSAGDSVVLATVTEGYRPPMNMFTVVCSSAAAGVGKAYIQITSTGDIQFHTTVAWSTSATIAFTVSWAK